MANGRGRNPLLLDHLQRHRRREAGAVRPACRRPCARISSATPQIRRCSTSAKRRQGRGLQGDRRHRQARRQSAPVARQRRDPRRHAQDPQARQGRSQAKCAKASNAAWPSRITTISQVGDASNASRWRKSPARCRGFGMKIKVVVHEAEEGGYWAEVPAIPGCATQGDSFEELLENLYEAIEGCFTARATASFACPYPFMEIVRSRPAC